MLPQFLRAVLSQRIRLSFFLGVSLWSACTTCRAYPWQPGHLLSVNETPVTPAQLHVHVHMYTYTHTHTQWGVVKIKRHTQYSSNNTWASWWITAYREYCGFHYISSLVYRLDDWHLLNIALSVKAFQNLSFETKRHTIIFYMSKCWVWVNCGSKESRFQPGLPFHVHMQWYTGTPLSRSPWNKGTLINRTLLPSPNTILCTFCPLKWGHPSN